VSVREVEVLSVGMESVTVVGEVRYDVCGWDLWLYVM
jgi:hypothetical protein